MSSSIVHFDIRGPELAILARFYEQLFGWRIEHRGDGYAQVDTIEGGLRGGIVESECHDLHLGIQVDDLKTTLASIEALGGTIEMPAIDNGWVTKAQVKDPAGNVLSLIQSEQMPVNQKD